MSSAIDEAMARFSFAGSGPESNANFRGCQPYQSPRAVPPPVSGGYRGGPQLPLPNEDSHHRPQQPIDAQQILAQILATNKNNRLGAAEMGGSSSNNSSSSRTGISSSRNHQTNDLCDMTMQSEYENVMRSPPKVPREETMFGDESQAAAAAGGRGGRRRLGRQESRYTSGKLSNLKRVNATHNSDS